MGSINPSPYYDPNDEDLPGDYGAVNSLGKEVFMVSYGAVAIDVRDAAGGKYNLMPGAAAVLETPIQNQQLLDATPPAATIPMWTFDTTSGAWRQNDANGVLAGGGLYYKTKLTSFSTKNADLEKTNPACIRIQLDPLVLGLGSLSARIDIQVGTTSRQRRVMPIDDANNVLYNLPSGAPFTIELFTGVPPAEQLVAARAGNTSTPWGGTGLPAYPYSACDATVHFADPVTPPAFLQYGKGTGNAAQAAGYYAGADPLGLRTTLGDFWTLNGFNAVDGLGGTRTSFLNDNDLGFGRDMNCRQNGSNVACYVSNYGQPDQEPGNADLAQNRNLADVVATVAMEYSAVEGGDPTQRIVKFFVYNGGVAISTRVGAADLDKAGAKFVPNLCLICHGGNYFPADPASPTFSELNMGASFREFDTYSFKYPTTNPQAAQEPNFHTQNLMVVASNPAPAIRDIVTEFYAGGATVDPNAVAPLWKPAANGGSLQPQALYLNLVAKSCRTCHTAQPGYDPLVVTPSAYPDWSSYSMFRDNRQFAYFLVCNSKVMPNALVTFKNFWLSLTPHRPEFFQSFTDAATGWPTSLQAELGFDCLP